jgi:nucleotide-binding universal stress UspA family protein
MPLNGPVLVGTNLSRSSDEALRQAARLANELSSKLFVCHVVPELIPDGSVFTEFRRANAKINDSLLDKARAAVELHVTTVLSGDTSNIEIVLDYGTPHKGLLTQTDAAGAGVVVTAPGSVALNVARHASAAVLIARASPKGPVVAATDFSDVSLRAVEVATAQAQRRGSRLHLLHASDVGLFALGQASAAAMPYLLSSSPIALEGLDNLHAVAQHRLDETLADIGVSGTTRVVAGSAADVIVHYAESVHAELVVVGTHGRSGLARLTLGSTAASVIEWAPCSVLIVRVSGN